MSCYKIYKSVDVDPVKYGKNKRILLNLVAIGFPLLVLPLNLTMRLEKTFVTWMILIAIGMFVIATGWVYYNLYSTRKNVKQLGELKILVNKLESNISGIQTEIPMDDVRNIQLKKHIPGGLLSGGKYGYFSYLMEVNRRDSENVSFMLSSESINGGTDLKNNLEFLQKKKVVNVMFDV